jgi:pyruvate/2-oxoglutarate dehydrogenase complex dihydrolipoamide acyltransferase (E2) component
MPRLADTLVEGTLARWLKQAGDRVRSGEPLAEIETDKVNTELQAPADGVLSEVLVQAGETVAVGTVIARIGGAPDAGVGAPVATAKRAGDAGGLSLMRRRIAERMQESRARVAQGACVREVRLGARRAGEDLSPTALFVKALAAATGCRNIGVAVDVPDGLVVPVVGDADRLSLPEISARIRDLAARSREGRLRPEEVLGAEFTVTNVGAVGTMMAFPLVPAGQPGILAPGAIRDGRCFLTLCYDRNAMDDYRADRLLARIAEELSKPV